MTFLSYGRQNIDENDIKSVIRVLESDFLTCGPMVSRFEAQLCNHTGAGYAVAVSSGTAALHCAMFALGIGPGDEVILPVITFAATANCVLYRGGTPVFCDVDDKTLCIDPAAVEKKITGKTKAIIAVDYAGLPCDYDKLWEIANKNGLYLVADACHSLGAEYKGAKVGTLADMTILSFHPVKHITTGEGGAVLTSHEDMAEKARCFSRHCVDRTANERQSNRTWHYEIRELGFNYRLTDFQCALGMSQLEKLDSFLNKRRKLAKIYDEKLVSIDGVWPLAGSDSHKRHAFHLYVVRIQKEKYGHDRDAVFQWMHDNSVGVNVHYIPLHFQPLYQQKLGVSQGMFPVAEAAYGEILTLPLHPGMCANHVKTVIDCLKTLG